MSNSERRVPPSRARVAQAAREGLFARSSALVAGLAMLCAAAAMTLLGEGLGPYFTGLVRTGLSNAKAGQSEAPAALLGALLGAARMMLPFFAAVFATALIGAVVPAAVARRGRGRTAVALPPAPKTRFSVAALYLFGVFLIALLAANIFRSHLGDVVGLMKADFGTSGGICEAVGELLAAGGLVMLLVGIAETAVLRIGIWKALHLDSLEARREQRAAGDESESKREGARRARQSAYK